jgi:hypothetical protein
MAVMVSGRRVLARDPSLSRVRECAAKDTDILPALTRSACAGPAGASNTTAPGGSRVLARDAAPT